MKGSVVQRTGGAGRVDGMQGGANLSVCANPCLHLQCSLLAAIPPPPTPHVLLGYNTSHVPISVSRRGASPACLVMLLTSH